MAGYRYGGTNFDARKKLTEPIERKKYERGTAKCGTTGGYNSHQRAKEPSCEPCLVAIRAYRKEWRARVRICDGKEPRFKTELPPLPPKKKRTRANAAACGTNSGYDAHLRHKTEICQPCRDAHNAYLRVYKAAWRARKKAA